MSLSIRRFRVLSTLTLLIVCWVVGVPKVTASDDEAAIDLISRLKAIDAFESGFVQLTLDENGEIIQRQTGRAAMVRPRGFLWRIEEPYVQVMVLQDDVVSIYEPDLEQITYSPIEETMDTSVVSLLFNEDYESFSNYVVSTLSAGFRLIPLPEIEMPIEVVEVYFDGETLAAIDVVDSQGQRTEFSFNDMIVNREIDEDQFAIEIPPGTEVVGTPPTVSSDVELLNTEPLTP